MPRSRTFFAAAVASCLSGCSFSLIDAGDMPRAAALPSKPLVCPKAPPAPLKLSLPKIPAKVKIIIDGDNVEVDAGGEALLRAYVKAREALD
ncbi:MAG: hypothetical protein L0177_18950 [Chloroflexi bacterium]|nr:hypothetical protein [Chloroflexota bacterium]